MHGPCQPGVFLVVSCLEVGNHEFRKGTGGALRALASGHFMPIRLIVPPGLVRCSSRRSLGEIRYRLVCLSAPFRGSKRDAPRRINSASVGENLIQLQFKEIASDRVHKKKSKLLCRELHHARLAAGEYAIEKPGDKLQALTNLDTDRFVAEVQRVRGRKLPLTAAGLQALRTEYTRTIEPARTIAAEALNLERALSDLVNQAYALTPEEIALLWETAPPRMPIPKPNQNG